MLSLPWRWSWSVLILTTKHKVVQLAHSSARALSQCLQGCVWSLESRKKKNEHTGAHAFPHPPHTCKENQHTRRMTKLRSLQIREPLILFFLIRRAGYFGYTTHFCLAASCSCLCSISYFQVSSQVVLKTSLEEKAKRTPESVTAAHLSSAALP